MIKVVLAFPIKGIKVVLSFPIKGIKAVLFFSILGNESIYRKSIRIFTLHVRKLLTYFSTGQPMSFYPFQCRLFDWPADEFLSFPMQAFLLANWRVFTVSSAGFHYQHWRTYELTYISTGVLMYVFPLFTIAGFTLGTLLYSTHKPMYIIILRCKAYYGHM